MSEDGTYPLPRCEFYGYGEKDPSVILLAGDAQPSVTGQYEVASIVLDFAQRFGCKAVYTMGGYGTRSGNDVERSTPLWERLYWESVSRRWEQNSQREALSQEQQA